MIYCTNRKTLEIHEAQCFTDYVLVRPARAQGERKVQKLGYVEFGKKFEEFYGDPAQVVAVVEGEWPTLMPN